jgi:hypothetical protein
MTKHEKSFILRKTWAHGLHQFFFIRSYSKSTTPTLQPGRQTRHATFRITASAKRNAAKKLHKARYPTGSCLAIAIALSVSLKYLWIICLCDWRAHDGWKMQNGPNA